MRDILEIMRERHSSRLPFNPMRRISDDDLQRILEAARWAPTAHNMQNFEAIVIDDEEVLEAIGGVHAAPSETFIRENYQQLSFSEDELQRKKTGLLASMLPKSWLRPDATSPCAAGETQHASLGGSMQDCPVLLVVVYDARKRAPASEGDVLGMMSLGCVMQNIWLMAEALGIGMQISSVFSGEEPQKPLHGILAIPKHMQIAFACRLGYPAASRGRYLRVRREVREFAHHNRYGNRVLTSC
jgi:nitroreductase